MAPFGLKAGSKTTERQGKGEELTRPWEPILSNRERVMENKDFDQLRHHKRFPVEESTFALLRAKGSKLGRVIDISKDGLSFRYLSIGGQLKGALQLDLISPHHDFTVNNLPVKIISSLEVASEMPFRSITLWRVGAKFGKLTQKQKTKLEYFIQHHTTTKD